MSSKRTHSHEDLPAEQEYVCPNVTCHAKKVSGGVLGNKMTTPNTPTTPKRDEMSPDTILDNSASCQEEGESTSSSEEESLDYESLSSSEEEEDSDDQIEVEEPPPRDVDPVPADSTSETRLVEQSELSLLGVASEEFFLHLLDTMPLTIPEPDKREHLKIQQQRYEVPPQSPKLGLNELGTAPLFKDKPIAKDRRLENWERWLVDRKRQHRRIGSALNDRAPPSLAMNSGEDTRYLNERKTVLDYARIPAPPDHYRGGPEFWRMPYFLNTKKNPEAPLYGAQMTLPDKGIIPTLEYIGVPDHVKKEKGVYGGPTDRKSPREMWKSNSYMKEQKIKMKEKLELVEKHEPDMRGLVIVGNYYQKIEAMKVKDVPVLTVSQDPDDMKEREFENEMTASLLSMLREENEGRTKMYRDLNGVACLKIQEREFYYLEPPKSRKLALQLSRERLMRMNSTENPIEFRLSFSSPPGKVETKIFRMENRGTVKVNYSWKRAKGRPPDFPVDVPMRTDVSGQHFFFNKNNDLLLPGQVLEFRFMYRSHFPGVFQECWTLHTVPTFVDDKDVFTVNLWGLTPPPDTLHDELRHLRDHVKRRISEAMAREAIQDSLESAKYRAYPDTPYVHNFLTEEKFLHVNPDFNFDGELVKNLCDLHDEICTADPKEEWDFKIPTLRQKIIDKTCDESRQGHLDTLTEIVIKLRKRAYTARDGRLRKYTAVYNLLCNLANTIDREGGNLRSIYGLSHPPEVPLEKKVPSVTDRRTSSIPKKLRVKSKSKRGSKPTSATKDLFKPNASRISVFDSSSANSLSDESVKLELTLPVVSPSKLLSMTAMFTPAAGFSESTVQLLSTLNMPVPIDTVPAVPMFPIVVPAKGDTPSMEVDESLVRRVYKQALFTMVNQALCHTVEHIVAVLDSYK